MATETILVVDDEVTVRTYIGAILRKEGFRLLEAFDGVDAMQQVERAGAPPDLLLTDVRMPRMDGIALARLMLVRSPETPVLFMSGFSFDIEEEQRGEQVCGRLPKPFSRQELVHAVRTCLDRANQSRGKC